MHADLQEQVKSDVLDALAGWLEDATMNPCTRVPRVASLFGVNKLREVAQKINTDQIQAELAVVRTWHADYHTGTLKKDKETSREQAYNQDFFMKILGYKEKPASPYTFEPKATTDKRQLPDAVLCYASASVKNIAAVVELKDASTLLDRPQQREGNMSPVQQGFKYKTQYRVCPFVVVSNFFEFRLYNDNQLDYERWTLDDLVDPADDYLKFKTWYVLMRAENMVAEQGKSATELLLSDIRQEQEEIGKKFYSEYKAARTALLQDIWTKNPKTRFKFAIAIQKAQTIIDRIVFACFAEDRGLLPDNIVARVTEFAASSPYDNSLFDQLKGFFGAIDKGSAKLQIPDGYNGGLFAKDPWIDALEISDAPLQRLTALGKYDFQEDLSVNILGHIFEQSITDLEEIRRVIAEDKKSPFDPAVTEPRKATSKRKKEGVYYTPDYIVRYIVDNTVGAFLRGHEQRLKDKYNLNERILDKTYAQREQRVYLEYQTVLQNVRVLDPACGSGAFLVYSFDYLMAENRRVHEILGAYEKEGATLFGVDEYVREILNNNLFGVDLNEESVEITKLSLWLKTAQKGKKLTALDENIKCGNSLINDPLAGDKSFDWTSEFPGVFEAGGFDVVVGNPPYVRIQNLDSEQVDYYFNTYETPIGKLDISILFFEKALQVLSHEGIMAFVSSSMWMRTDYGRNLRRILATGLVEEIIDFGSLPVFEDASTYPAIFTITKAEHPNLNYSRVTEKSQLNSSSVRALAHTPIEYSRLSEAPWEFGDFNLIETLTQRGVSFSRLSDVGRGYVGDISGQADTFVLTKAKATELGLEQELLYPYVYRGNEVFRYTRVDPDAVLIYPYTPGPNGEAVLIDEDTLLSKYPKIHAYLLQFKERLKLRLDSRKLYAAGADWYKHVRPGNFNHIYPPKLIVKGIDKRAMVGYADGDTAFNGMNCTGVIIEDEGYSPDYVYGILNSKLCSQYLNSICPPKLNNTFRYNTNNVNLIPIVGKSHACLESHVAEIRSLVIELAVLSDRFRTLVTDEYQLKAWSPKLASWWSLEFKEFVRIAKLKLTLSQKDELLTFWTKYQEGCSDLDSRINALDDAIDQEIYEIYQLQPGEIAIVESLLAPAEVE